MLCGSWVEGSGGRQLTVRASSGHRVRGGRRDGPRRVVSPCSPAPDLSNPSWQPRAGKTTPSRQPQANAPSVRPPSRQGAARPPPTTRGRVAQQGAEVCQRSVTRLSRNCADPAETAPTAATLPGRTGPCSQRPAAPSLPGHAVSARPLCANGAARYSRSLTRQRQLFARVASHGRHSRGAGAGERPPLRLPHRRRLAPVALHDRWDRARRMVQPVQRRPGHQRPCSVGSRRSPAARLQRPPQRAAPPIEASRRWLVALARPSPRELVELAACFMWPAFVRASPHQPSQHRTGRLSTPTLNQVCPQPRSEGRAARATGAPEVSRSCAGRLAGEVGHPSMKQRLSPVCPSICLSLHRSLRCRSCRCTSESCGGRRHRLGCSGIV